MRTGHDSVLLQPDFVQQKSKLAEYIEKRGHICNFYPKYHCKLNFIEQYWGAAKYRYPRTPQTHSMDKMHENIRTSLDNIPLAQIQWYVLIFMYVILPSIFYRYANLLARFMHAYWQGLTGGEAAWANKWYHSHCTLPPSMMSRVREEYSNKK
jgi:hypothetical protein